MKEAFIVIVDYDEESIKPAIGDIQWAILDALASQHLAWQIHTTELTAAMLKRHDLPAAEQETP